MNEPLSMVGMEEGPLPVGAGLVVGDKLPVGDVLMTRMGIVTVTATSVDGVPP